MSLPLQFLLGFGICLALSLVSLALAPAMKLVDIPRGRHQHEYPVAKVGGIALILALLIRTAILGPKVHLSLLETGAIALMAGVGLADDRWDIPPRYKAIVSAGFAVVLAYLAATSSLHSSDGFHLMGLHLPGSALVRMPLLFLVFWAFPNAYNLIDGANGLAIGFGLILLVTMGLAGFWHPFMTGALLATFLFNWPKPRLFLGDCGSLAMGLLLVILAKSCLAHRDPNQILWLFAYPCVDVLLVIGIRLLHRRSLGQGDRSHLHHQLGDRWPGLRAWTVPWLWLMAAMCASSLYLRGWLRIVPWLGLGLLLLQAFLFLALEAQARQGKRHLSVADTH